MRDFVIVLLIVVFVFSGFSLTQTSYSIVAFTENKIIPFFQVTEQQTEVLIASAMDLEREEGTLKSEGIAWYENVANFFIELKDEIVNGFTGAKNYIVEDIKNDF